MTGRNEAEPVLRSMNLRNECISCPFLFRLYDEHTTFEDLTRQMQQYIDCSLPDQDINPAMLSTVQLALEDYAEKSDGRLDKLINKLRSISYACNMGGISIRVFNESTGYDAETFKCNSKKIPQEFERQRVVKIYPHDDEESIIFND